VKTRSPGLRRLFVTCGALALALAPHVTHLPVWISAGFVGSVLWRLLAEQRGWALPRRSLRAGAALGATLAVFAGYRTLNGLEAGTALLSVMACLKLLETRAPRDHAVLVFVGYLLCLATLLVEQSFVRLGYVLAAVWLLTAALARVHRPVEANTEVRPFRLAARLLALGLPLAVVLFLFVPRIEGRFWALPTSAPRHVTGIDDEMSPGDVAQLGLSDDPAFRAWFEGAPPPAERRYWRVLVLEEFDGRRWRRRTTAADFAAPEIVAGSALYDYRIVLEPTSREWLAGLDTIVGWPSGETSRGRATNLVRVDPRIAERVPVTAPFSYSLRSALDAAVMPSALPRDLSRRDLQLPEGRSPRARALALELRAGSRDERDYIERVLERFRREAFEYTLEPPPLGAEPVDEFLFATRQGFCEHYASAFAVLMRAAGIPARVVVGYQGGEFNTYGRYLLVRQSSAHAWDEVWLAGAGWVRVDPTAAVAPDRVRRGSLPRMLTEGVGERLFGDLPWLTRARALWDAGRTAWYEAVVNFDPSRQQRLLERIGLGERSWQGLAIALAAGFGLTALALGAWLAWELRPRNRDPLVTGWNTVCNRLARAGVPRAPAEGPLDYARRVAVAMPALAAAMAELADSYVAARYLPGAGPAATRYFLALASNLRRRLRSVRP
jgi:transglutaminase-like putative cysteine protease